MSHNNTTIHTLSLSNTLLHLLSPTKFGSHLSPLPRPTPPPRRDIQLQSPDHVLGGHVSVQYILPSMAVLHLVPQLCHFLFTDSSRDNGVTSIRFGLNGHTRWHVNPRGLDM